MTSTTEAAGREAAAPIVSRKSQLGEALTDLCHHLLTGGTVSLDLGTDLTGSTAAAGVVGVGPADSDRSGAGVSGDTAVTDYSGSAVANNTLSGTAIGGNGVDGNTDADQPALTT